MLNYKNFFIELNDYKQPYKNSYTNIIFYFFSSNFVLYNLNFFNLRKNK